MSPFGMDWSISRVFHIGAWVSGVCNARLMLILCTHEIFFNLNTWGIFFSNQRKTFFRLIYFASSSSVYLHENKYLLTFISKAFFLLQTRLFIYTKKIKKKTREFWWLLIRWFLVSNSIDYNITCFCLVF